jgi:predicted nucleotidyltransferase
MKYTTTEIAQRVKPVAERYALPEVYLFGSYARGSNGDESDIDLLVRSRGSKVNSAFDMGLLFSDLEAALEKEIDLVTIESLDLNTRRRGRRHFAESLLNEKVLIYAQP